MELKLAVVAMLLIVTIIFAQQLPATATSTPTETRIYRARSSETASATTSPPITHRQTTITNEATPMLTIPFYPFGDPFFSEPWFSSATGSLIDVTFDDTTVLISSRTIIYGTDTYKIDATITASPEMMSYMQYCSTTTSLTVKCCEFSKVGTSDYQDIGSAAFFPHELGGITTALVALTGGGGKLTQKHSALAVTIGEGAAVSKGRGGVIKLVAALGVAVVLI